MKRYPAYDIESTQVARNKMTITIVSRTACGVVRVKATVNAVKNDTLADLEDAAKSAAAVALDAARADLIATCISKGLHQGHRP